MPPSFASRSRACGAPNYEKKKLGGHPPIPRAWAAPLRTPRFPRRLGKHEILGNLGALKQAIGDPLAL